MTNKRQSPFGQKERVPHSLLLGNDSVHAEPVWVDAVDHICILLLTIVSTLLNKVAEQLWLFFKGHSLWQPACIPVGEVCAT